jgi:hypothetical protein
VIRFSRLSGLVLGFAIVVCAGGLGLHAVRDWHRHGEFGAGFFHLHFHIGQHEHHDHEDPERDGHDGEEPSDHQERRTAVLTVAQAVHDLGSATPTVTVPEIHLPRTPLDRVRLPQHTELLPSASPRAPPA